MSMRTQHTQPFHTDDSGQTQVFEWVIHITQLRGAHQTDPSCRKAFAHRYIMRWVDDIAFNGNMNAMVDDTRTKAIYAVAVAVAAIRRWDAGIINNNLPDKLM